LNARAFFYIKSVINLHLTFSLLVMSLNKKYRYLFKMCSFQHCFIKQGARRIGITPDHLIGKIIRRKIRLEEKKAQQQRQI